MMLEVKKHGMLMELPATHSVCSLTRSLPLGNVDSFAPAHLAPEGLPLALSRATTLAAWVPSSPTFICSSSVSSVSSVVKSAAFGVMQDWSKPHWPFIGLRR